MPDFLKQAVSDVAVVNPLDVLLRLCAALVLGWVVAAIYRRTRQGTEVASSFPVTLVLLSVLIAMVTQVIGSNVARAFSLVGALSIVRFRTVVRDTQDTAYVIFAVAVGMAMGAKDLWVGVLGVLVVGVAAYLMMVRARVFSATGPAYVLHLRVGLGCDLETAVRSAIDAHFQERELVAMGTARQGASIEVSYEGRLRAEAKVAALVQALNRVEGVQNVEVRRQDFEKN